MTVSRLHARLLAAAALAVLSAGPLLAQGVGCATCTGGGSYGGALFAPNKSMSHRPDGCHPLCANNNYPLSDYLYIRKYCGPTFVPGSCYGYFQTKWRKWEDACPGGACGAGGPADEPIFAAPPPGVVYPPTVQPQPPVTPPTTPDKSQPLPQPTPQPKADPAVPPKTGTTPPKTPTDPPHPPLDPVVPPKSPLVPKPDEPKKESKGLASPTEPISAPTPMPLAIEAASDATPRPLPDRTNTLPPLPELPASR